MKQISVLIAVVFIAFPIPAWPVNDWGFSGCADESTPAASLPTTPSVYSGRHCFDFNTSLSPASTSFLVAGLSAIACLKTDVDQEGVSATGASPATAIVRYAPYGDVSAAANAGVQVCAQAGCTLTGANGVPSAQLVCVPLGPGKYRVDFPTLPDSPDVGLFSVEGAE